MIMLFAIIILAIFLLISRRKLGFFVMAIFAGSVLNEYWNKPVTDFLTTASLNIPPSTLSGFVGLVLILTPAFLVLMKSAKQEKMLFGVIGSIFVAIFVVAIVAGYLRAVFTFDSFANDILKLLQSSLGGLILASVIYALFSSSAIKVKKLDKNS